MINTQFNGSPEGLKDITSYFIEQWKEWAVNNLKNKIQLTGWGVWLHAFVTSVGVTIVTPFSLSFTKFNRWYAHHDTVESLLGLKKEEFNWDNNKEVSMTVAQRVSYLNDMIAAAHMQPLDGSIKASPAVTTDGKFITIPRELYMNNKLNIKIDPNMKWRIAQNNGDIVIPVDVSLRMAAQPQSQWIEYILNIGSMTSGMEDLHLIRWRETLLDTEWFFVDKQDIKVLSRQKIEGINISNLNDQLISLWIENMSVTKIDWDIITYTDGSWVSHAVSINGWDINGITFSMIDSKLTLTKVTPAGKEKREVSVEYTKTLTDVMIQAIDTQALSLLEKFETKPEFIAFLEAAMAHRIEDAISSLSKLDISGLSEYMAQADSQTKSEIVAYMISAFALEPEYQKGDISALKLMDARDNTSRDWSLPAYMRIKGGEKMKDFLTRDMFKNAYKDNIDKVGDISKPKINNLLWFTAFYRKNAGNNARGYAMTLPGYTNVLWGTVNKFDNAQEGAAKKWIFDKINSDTFAKNAILQWLKTKLPENMRDQITTDNLITILGWDTVTLPEWGTIQVTATPVYYLLAECANESVWLQIDAIILRDIPWSSDTRIIDGNMTEEYIPGRVSINNWGTTSSAKIRNGSSLSIAAAASVKYSQEEKPLTPKPLPDEWTDPEGTVNPDPVNPAPLPEEGTNSNSRSYSFIYYSAYLIWRWCWRYSGIQSYQEKSSIDYKSMIDKMNDRNSR